MAEAAFSLSQATPDISCPTTGAVCPAKELLLNLYTSHADNDFNASLPFDESNPIFDRAKLGIKLIEHAGWVRVRGCEAGPLAVAGAVVCPPRHEMDASPVRQKAVWGIRQVLSRFRKS